MERIEERELVAALVRQTKKYEEEELLPLEALEALDMPVYELLKAREIPRRWKVC